jgi:hypothetical protein
MRVDTPPLQSVPNIVGRAFTVLPGTKHVEVRYRFFTEEYPVYYGTQYDDTWSVVVTSAKLGKVVLHDAGSLNSYSGYITVPNVWGRGCIKGKGGKQMLPTLMSILRSWVGNGTARKPPELLVAAESQAESSLPLALLSAPRRARAHCPPFQ